MVCKACSFNRFFLLPRVVVQLQSWGTYSRCTNNRTISALNLILWYIGSDNHHVHLLSSQDPFTLLISSSFEKLEVLMQFRVGRQWFMLYLLRREAVKCHPTILCGKPPHIFTQLQNLTVKLHCLLYYMSVSAWNLWFNSLVENICLVMWYDSP